MRKVGGGEEEENGGERKRGSECNEKKRPMKMERRIPNIERATLASP